MSRVSKKHIKGLILLGYIGAVLAKYGQYMGRLALATPSVSMGKYGECTAVRSRADRFSEFRSRAGFTPKSEVTRRRAELDPAGRRVFSILNNTFDDNQDRSLADYIELSLQLQFNARSRSAE